jgi:endonuclease/exonuclease/phosphatase family metal-dependent hydrolase
MLIATWNLNNRVGLTKFRPEAAQAAADIGADLLVFTEYFPLANARAFTDTLHKAGWDKQLISSDTGEKANRVLMACRHQLHPLDVKLPDFDRQFPANVLCALLPTVNLSVIGVRVPWYDGSDMPMVFRAWDWLEAAAAALAGRPAVILGDLNVGLKSGHARGGDHFRRMLASGWHRAEPSEGASFYTSGGGASEIDHILGSGSCHFGVARYVASLGQHKLAGCENAISDHAALVADVTVLN